MIMRYGGDDLVEAFMNCVQSVSFPYKDCNLAREWDWELMQWLMEQCCAANEVSSAVLCEAGGGLIESG